jgi:hypothetical protein
VCENLFAKWVDATSPVTVTVRVCFGDGAVSWQDSWGAPTCKEEGEKKEEGRE